MNCMNSMNSMSSVRCEPNEYGDGECVCALMLVNQLSGSQQCPEQ